MPDFCGVLRWRLHGVLRSAATVETYNLSNQFDQNNRTISLQAFQEFSQGAGYAHPF
jgi:hypothetical protein